MDDSQPQDNPLAERLAHVLEGAYTLEGEIGRGGMGVVFLARDLALNRRVAIKLLPPELASRQEIKTRFMREAQTAARLSHPHIVPIHAVGDEGGLVYFVMGYVDGESLAAGLRRRHALPPEETCGDSPALARKVRGELERAYGTEYGVFLEKMANLRRRLLTEVAEEDVRRKINQAMVDSDVLYLLQAGQNHEADMRIAEIVKVVAGGTATSPS